MYKDARLLNVYTQSLEVGVLFHTPGENQNFFQEARKR